MATTLLGTFIHLNHLAGCRDIRLDDVVSQQNRKRLVVHEIFRHQDRVPEPERLLLAHVGNVHHVGNGAHQVQQIRLAALFQDLLEFEGDVKVVLDGVFAPPGDNNEVFEPRIDGFLNCILYDGLVYQRQHFFGLRFRCRQKPRSQARSGENRSPDFRRVLPPDDSR